MGKTVAILHGWAGGNWHLKQFRRALEDAGFKVVHGQKIADIIVAHSAGCYRLKEGTKAEIIMAIGPAYWPGRSILRRLLTKKRHDTKVLIERKGHQFAIKRFVWEVIYVFAKPHLTFIAFSNQKHLHFLDRLKNKKVYLIRNKDDSICSPDIRYPLEKYKNVRYLELPGGHDDFMINPEPYIDLLLKEL